MQVTTSPFTKDELLKIDQADDPANRIKRNLVALLCRYDKRM
jgi:hypothetical protein